MLQHSTHFTFLIKIYSLRKDQNTVNRNEYEILKEAIVNIIKENSVTRVGFERKMFDNLTFDFYTHGT